MSISVRLGEAFVAIRASTRLLSKDLTTVNRQIQQSLNKVSQRLQRTGHAMTTGVTLPAVAMGVAIQRTAFNFQQSMNRVQAITGATGERFDQLQALARQLGETTEFSASQAADGMAFLAQAGFEVNEILGALPGTLQLASAGQLDLASAADIASNLLTQFGLEAEQIGRVNDTLAATASSANVNVRQVAESMKLVGATANQVDRPIEEIAAVLGMLGDSGIQGSIAGTSLNRALLNMVAPSSTARKAMEKLNLEVTDANGNLKPFADILEQVEVGLSQVRGSGDRAGMVMEAFGIRGGRAIGALVGRSGDLRDFVEDLENAGGTAERMQQTQLQGLVGAFREMQSAVEGAALSVSEAGLDSFTIRFLGGVTKLARGLSKSNPEIIAFGSVIVGALAAAGPALLGLAIAIKGVSVALALLGRRMVMIPLLVSGLAVAFKSLADSINTNLDQATVNAVDRVEELREQGKSLGEALTIANREMESAANNQTSVWDRFTENLAGNMKAIGDAAGEGFGAAMEALMGTMPEAGAEIEKILADAEEGSKKLEKVLKDLQEQMEGTGGEGGDKLKQALEDINFEIDVLQGKFGDLSPEAVKSAREMGILGDNFERITIHTKEGEKEVIRYTDALAELSDAHKELKEEQDKQAESTEQLGNLVDQLGFQFSSAFEDALVSGKDASDIMKGLEEDIRRVAARLLIVEPIIGGVTSAIKGAMSGGGGGGGEGQGFFRQLFGSILGFQHGGRMRRGQAGIVGEAGAELFVPDVSGQIIPNHELGTVAMGGSGANVQVNVYAPPGSDVESDQRQSGGREEIDVMIDQSVAGLVTRPGSQTSRALRGQYGLGRTVTRRS